MPPIPASVLFVLLGAHDVREGVFAVHAAIQFDIEFVLGCDIPVPVQGYRPENKGISPPVFVLDLIHVHDVTVGRHHTDDTLERSQSFVHLVDLTVQEVDLILHGNQLVPDELSATSGQENGRKDDCCDLYLHFHGFFLLIRRKPLRPGLL